MIGNKGGLSQDHFEVLKIAVTALEGELDEALETFATCRSRKTFKGETIIVWKAHHEDLRQAVLSWFRCDKSLTSKKLMGKPPRGGLAQALQEIRRSRA